MSESRTAAKQNKEFESSTSYFLKGHYCNLFWAKLRHSKNTCSFTELFWPDFGIKNGCEIILAHPMYKDSGMTEDARIQPGKIRMENTVCYPKREDIDQLLEVQVAF